MSQEQTEVSTEATETVAKSELELLKAQADRMGITYSGNISLTTLKSKINAKLASEEESTEVVKDESKEALLRKKHQEAIKLVRVVVTSLDSNKASNLDSEIITVGNALVGTITRTIPFGRPWHIEQIMLDALREKQFQQFTTKKNAQGIPITTSRLVPAYGIQELPALTKEELAELALQQARTGSLLED